MYYLSKSSSSNNLYLENSMSIIYLLLLKCDSKLLNAK